MPSNEYLGTFVMRELGLNLKLIQSVIVRTQDTPYAVIEVPARQIFSLATELGVAVRRYYVSDAKLEERYQATAIAKDKLVAAKLPDRGSVMSGDFGEILTALLQAAGEYPTNVLDPKKWRLKQDRTKAAPYSDVVQFMLPQWPIATANDRLVCAEVKTKSTPGTFAPITAAIGDAKKDRGGRLAKTLVWLRERAMDTDLGTVSIAQLSRFIDAVDYPPASREFRAVAVICSTLIDAELRDIEVPATDECALIVISVPDLKRNYEELFEAVISSIRDDEDQA